MNPSGSRERDLAAVASAVQRFHRLRASKTTHAALLQAADVDLTQQSLQLLVVLSDGQTASELASASQMDAAAVSRELRRLEHDGLIERSANPHHHAGVVVRLTDAGCDARDRIVAVRRAHMARALDGWSAADIASLSRLLGRLVDDLQAAPVGGDRPRSSRP